MHAELSCRWATCRLHHYSAGCTLKTYTLEKWQKQLEFMQDPMMTTTTFFLNLNIITRKNDLQKQKWTENPIYHIWWKYCWLSARVACDDIYLFLFFYWFDGMLLYSHTKDFSVFSQVKNQTTSSYCMFRWDEFDVYINNNKLMSVALVLILLLVSRFVFYKL